MKRVFADTFYFLALLNRKDSQHDRAKRSSAGLRVQIVTTIWILTELADAMCSVKRRSGFATTLKLLTSDPDITIVPAEESTWNAGYAGFNTPKTASSNSSTRKGLRRNAAKPIPSNSARARSGPKPLVRITCASGRISRSCR